MKRESVKEEASKRDRQRVRHQSDIFLHVESHVAFLVSSLDKAPLQVPSWEAITANNCALFDPVQVIGISVQLHDEKSTCSSDPY